MSVTDASADALRRGLAPAPADATLVGVVRDPDPGFRRLVDTNVPELAPPAPVLADAREVAAEFRMAGMCAEGAHNAAWDDVGVLERYRDRLDDDPAARTALDGLRERVRAGESLVIVDTVGPNRRSHRVVLAERLACTERGR
ncbi:hypothetical protein [Natronomonas sp. EA1]|uniref:hypothetical protein n=1 Tax=Natronomonas sp. EA1 TaxID=3421655 RepID=UPI003EB936B7